MHAYLKARFLPPERRVSKMLLLHNANGEVIDEYEIDLSTTTTLNKIEFSEYLHAIQVFAGELGVIVGSKDGGIWLPGVAWDRSFTTKDFLRHLKTRKELADTILEEVQRHG